MLFEPGPFKLIDLNAILTPREPLQLAARFVELVRTADPHDATLAGAQPILAADLNAGPIGDVDSLLGEAIDEHTGQTGSPIDDAGDGAATAEALAIELAGLAGELPPAAAPAPLPPVTDPGDRFEEAPEGGPAPAPGPAPPPAPAPPGTPDYVAQVREQIRQLYLELLFREPDPGGWDEWTHHVIDEGHTIEWVREQIEQSDEFKEKHPEG